MLCGSFCRLMCVVLWVLLVVFGLIRVFFSLV